MSLELCNSHFPNRYLFSLCLAWQQSVAMLCVLATCPAFPEVVSVCLFCFISLAFLLVALLGVSVYVLLDVTNLNVFCFVVVCYIKSTKGHPTAVQYNVRKVICGDRRTISKIDTPQPGCR